MRYKTFTASADLGLVFNLHCALIYLVTLIEAFCQNPEDLTKFITRSIGNLFQLKNQ